MLYLLSYLGKTLEIVSLKKMVGVAGFEPAAHWSQTSCATKLRYTPKIVLCVFFKKLVSPQGFEPRTHGLEGRCSIQLSYEPTHL